MELARKFRLDDKLFLVARFIIFISISLRIYHTKTNRESSNIPAEFSDKTVTSLIALAFQF